MLKYIKMQYFIPAVITTKPLCLSLSTKVQNLHQNPLKHFTLLLLCRRLPLDATPERPLQPKQTQEYSIYSTVNEDT